MIYYNNLSAFTEVHLGNTNITEVYFGDVKKWPTGSQPFGGKFKLTLNDSTVITKDCDASTTITQSEVDAYSATTVIAEIGGCVLSIGFMAFFNTPNLRKVILPNGLITIGTDAFYTCPALTAITIPNSVANINQYAFSGCYGLTSIDIPDSVTTIGGQAFNSCTALTSVTIGTGVTEIRNEAFQYCRSLTSVTVNAVTPPTLGNNVFNTTNNCPIYVPAESVNTYKSASGWSNYSSRIQAIP